MGSRARATGDDKPSVRVMGRGMRPLSYLQTPTNPQSAFQSRLFWTNPPLPPPVPVWLSLCPP
ncbi:hypothetical protein A6L30_10970 [Neisseria meningitidis]|uniref:Uncharacterized protein n=2 Tax=Neisseria meningitidis TaxID=487 RepID=Q9JZU3_NEIMB|nr:hypothetical protein NMB0898 [Neisseria meningitidis MC58]ANW71480.1 hypothetical protein QP84_008625 [Neisseria meningitidis]CAM10121.1 conserved hypothetical protein [Neisseria meningitidis FAM18]ANX28743.1 hypothetical protein A6L30_10970 [Neisseria meningitidis]AOA35548.1 hypothetical protein A6L22_09955 [Neisseria meningitidis]